MSDKKQIKGYALVRDKDGVLKYYKDGKFFTKKEIQEAVARSSKKESENSPKKVLKPVLSYQKKSEPKKKIDIEEALEQDWAELNSGSDLTKAREEDKKNIEKKVQEVIKRLKISFSDEKIKQRFINILITYFRGIRSRKEIEYALALPKMSGGLEISGEKARLIGKVLENYQEEVHNGRKKTVEKVEQKPIVRKETVDLRHRIAPPPPAVNREKNDGLKKLDQLIKQESAQQYVFSKNKVKSVSEPAERSSSIKQQTKNKELSRNSRIEKQKMKTMIKPKPEKPSLKQSDAKERPVMNDVKRASRYLTGPLEELEYMDLKGFRLLGKTNDAMIDAMKNKLNILVEQSLPQKIQGIKAWRRSPVFQLYLDMNLQGIREDKSLQEVIEARQFANQETLSLSEYETIGQLNTIYTI